MYYAIIGDIIGSKALENRSEVQEKLNAILRTINTEYEKNIAANFVITLGDEFQGLLINPVSLLEIIQKIKLYMYPVKIRFGIGIGDIYTEINREMAIGADGPAYHNARAMVEKLKSISKSNSKSMYNSDVMLMDSGVEGKDDIIQLINDNFCLCYFIESKWTEKQIEIIKKTNLGSRGQRELAKELNLAQSTIHRRLKASGYYNCVHVYKNITRIMVEVWGGSNEH